MILYIYDNVYDKDGRERYAVWVAAPSRSAADACMREHYSAWQFLLQQTTRESVESLLTETDLIDHWVES